MVILFLIVTILIIYIGIARALYLKKKMYYIRKEVEKGEKEYYAEREFNETYNPAPEIFWLFWYPIKWFSNLILKFLISNK